MRVSSARGRACSQSGAAQLRSSSSVEPRVLSWMRTEPIGAPLALSMARKVVAEPSRSRSSGSE